MSPPVVAFTCRVVEESSYAETRDALSVDWTAYCNRKGWLPVLVPNGVADVAAFLSGLGVRAVVLTGGNTMSNIRGDKVAGIYESRENTEREILNHAVSTGLPVFGVCRGLQAINRYFGGDVTHGVGKAAGHVATTHEVILSEAWRSLSGRDSLAVNSFHDDAIADGQAAVSLEVTAFCPASGFVEGMRHISLPIAGVQWHIERDNPAAAAFDDALIENVFNVGLETALKC